MTEQYKWHRAGIGGRYYVVDSEGKTVVGAIGSPIGCIEKHNTVVDKLFGEWLKANSAAEYFLSKLQEQNKKEMKR